MKKNVTFLLAMLFVISVSAQEQDTREVRAYEPNTIGTGMPIDVTKEYSEVHLNYGMMNGGMGFYMTGDYLTRIVFTGYNPGKEQERHLTVQVSTNKTEKYFKTVFDGNYTIPQGGTAEACIPMVTIDFTEPFLLDNWTSLYVNVSCSGEPSETPVYFELNEDESSYLNPILPSMQLTILSDVSYFETSVCDQDDNPVSGATVTVHNDMLAFDGISGDDGKANVRVGDNNGVYCLSVTAPGFPEYLSEYFYVKDVSNPSPYVSPAPDNIILRNMLDFTAEHPATIILPEAPNPAWGRYYRLDRHEGRDIIFEREYEPKADTPYVIFPYEDFSINLAIYDLSKCEEPASVPFPDTKEFGHTGFQGSYKSQPTRTDLYDGEFLYLIDTTPDCTKSNSLLFGYRIGACRAYFVMGAYSVEMKYEGPRYVFVGEELTGIDGVVEETITDHQVFDLQGRRLSQKPARGLYIQNGRKFVIK